MIEDSENEALSFIRDIALDAKVILLYHGDGDGVCSAVLIYKCLQRRGISEINPLPLERGENPFSERTTEKISSFFALFQLNSPHQIHPLIASIWSAKLSRYVVIAANWGYLPGKVSFSMRTESGKDLLILLKKYRKAGEEIGFGHSKATGGIVKEEVFRDFLKRLGFDGVSMAQK